MLRKWPPCADSAAANQVFDAAGTGHKCRCLGATVGRGTAALLQAGRENRVALFTSAPLLAELSDILGRSKFEKKIAVSGYSVDQLVDRYAELAKLVRPVAIAPTLKDDPDDDQVLACAVAARADVIVSGDHHLLDLGGFEGISIITVAEAVKRTDIDTLGR